MIGDSLPEMPRVPAWMQGNPAPRLTSDEKDAAREIFEGRVDGKSACHFCAGIHAAVAGLPATRQPCPRVKRIEWHPDGTVLVLEYHHPSDWADENTIFPHDVYDE